MSERNKELRILLERVRTHPSAELTEERERIVVLQNLIAGHAKRPESQSAADSTLH
jgi:hypothetical protein